MSRHETKPVKRDRVSEKEKVVLKVLKIRPFRTFTPELREPMERKRRSPEEIPEEILVKKPLLCRFLTKPLDKSSPERMKTKTVKGNRESLKDHTEEIPVNKSKLHALLTRPLDTSASERTKTETAKSASPEDKFPKIRELLETKTKHMKTETAKEESGKGEKVVGDNKQVKVKDDEQLPEIPDDEEKILINKPELSAFLNGEQPGSSSFKEFSIPPPDQTVADLADAATKKVLSVVLANKSELSAFLNGEQPGSSSFKQFAIPPPDQTVADLADAATKKVLSVVLANKSKLSAFLNGEQPGSSSFKQFSIPPPDQTVADLADAATKKVLSVVLANKLELRAFLNGEQPGSSSFKQFSIPPPDQTVADLADAATTMEVLSGEVVESDKTDEEHKDVKAKLKKRGPGKCKCPVPQCGRPLTRSKYVLKYHFKAFHSTIPNSKRDELISIATKTRRSKKLKPDWRDVRKVCIFCKKPFSSRWLCKAHLDVSSKHKCTSIPTEELEAAKEDKGDWMSKKFKLCEEPQVLPSKEEAGESPIAVDDDENVLQGKRSEILDEERQPTRERKVIGFTKQHTESIRKLFQSYITQSVTHPQKKIVKSEILAEYEKNMNNLYTELKQYSRDQICVKVRIVINQERRKEETKKKKEEAFLLQEMERHSEEKEK